MPSQACGSPRPTPRSYPSTATGGSVPFPRSSGRRWRRCSSLALLTIGCATATGVPPASATDDAAVIRRARLLRIEDTRRDEPAYVDSVLMGADAVGRAEAALTVGRIAARAHVPSLRALAADPDSAV